MVPADSSKVVDTNRGASTTNDTQYDIFGDMSMKQPFFMISLGGVTMAAGIRRRPNCFNLVFQLEFLCRTGMSKEHSVKSLEVPNYWDKKVER